MSEFKVGDLVEAKVQWRIGEDNPFQMADWETELLYPITLIEAAPEPLPTTPGLYLSALREGTNWVFELNDAGDWRLLNTNSPFRIGDGHLERNAPFTRLGPVPDTAKRVLERVSGVLFRGGITQLPNEFGNLAAEFGVTS